MQSSWDSQAYAAQPAGGSGNAVIVLLLAVLTFGYFGCVRPLTEELRATRISVACLQNRVAKLVSETETAGKTAGLLARLIDQRESIAQANHALEEVEALNRRLAERTRQIALLATSEDLARQTLSRIAQGRELLGAAEQALADSGQAQHRLVAANKKLIVATETTERMHHLCERLAAARPMIADAEAAQDDLALLNERLIIAARQTPIAVRSLGRLTNLSEQLVQSGPSAAAAQRISQLESLEARLVSAHDRTEVAALALESLTDLQADAVAASGAFRQTREMLLEVALMQPAIDRAVATLEPIRRLASLRHLDDAQLQVAAKALQATSAARR